MLLSTRVMPDLLALAVEVRGCFISYLSILLLAQPHPVPTWVFRAQPGQIFPRLVVASAAGLFYHSRFSRAILFTFFCFSSKPHWDEGGASEKLELCNTQGLILPNVVATSVLIVVTISNKVWSRQEDNQEGFSTSRIFQLTLFHCLLCLITLSDHSCALSPSLSSSSSPTISWARKG